MTRRSARTFLAAVLAASGLGAFASAQVTVREEALTIPTWEIGPPAVHPLFPAPQGPIYPYTLNDVLTDRKVDKTYKRWCSKTSTSGDGAARDRRARCTAPSTRPTATSGCTGRRPSSRA